MTSIPNIYHYSYSWLTCNKNLRMEYLHVKFKISFTCALELRGSHLWSNYPEISYPRRIHECFLNEIYINKQSFSNFWTSHLETVKASKNQTFYLKLCEGKIFFSYFFHANLFHLFYVTLLHGTLFPYQIICFFFLDTLTSFSNTSALFINTSVSLLNNLLHLNSFFCFINTLFSFWEVLILQYLRLIFVCFL